MYFRKQVTSNILAVDDFYANLNDIGPDGTHFYDFSYRIPMMEAFRQSALRVNVSIYSKLVRRQTVLGSSNIIDASRAQMLEAKTAKIRQQSFLVYSVSSDVTAAVDNTIVKDVATGNMPSHAFRKTALRTRTTEDIEITGDDIKIDMLQKPREASSVSHRRLNEELLASGKDPSVITSMTHASIPPFDSVRGLSPKQRTEEPATSAAQALLSSYLEGNQFDSTHAVELANVQNDDTTIGVYASFVPKDQSVYYIVFDLLNTSGEIIQTVEKTLDVSLHSQMFYTPRRAPAVSMTSSTQQHTTFNIKSLDKRTSSVNVYRKAIGRSSTTINDYEFIANIALSTFLGGSAQYRAEKAHISTFIYRFVPVGRTGIEGFDFSNIVQTPATIRQRNAVAVSLQPLSTGVEIHVGGYSTNVVAVQPIVRNISIFEKAYKNIAAATLVDGPGATRLVTFLYPGVSDGQSYEFAVRLYYRNGTNEVAGTSVLHYVAQQPGKVTTFIKNLSVDKSNSPNVKFTIDTTLINTNIDIAKQLLEAAKMIDYFKDDVQKEREFLSSMLAHNVQRVNITTGEREDFGVLASRDFDDALLREKNSVAPLQLGHIYRYEISTLLRAPETLFQELIKERIDPYTKKRYKFSPSKFFHPITLTEGVLVTNEGLAARYAKDQMMYGNTGVSQTLEVALDTVKTTAESVNVVRFDRDLNLITWHVSGNITNVDHFLIAKQCQGIKTMIGKTHSEFLHGNCRFYHDLTPRDIGELVYIITPVFNDYTAGLSVQSSPVVVEGI